MAASIESRVPFLDHKLVEFAAALPPRLKLRGFTTKWILREAVRSILPAEILSRPKMGFPVPFGLWMRGGVERHRPRRPARLARAPARHRRSGRGRAAARGARSRRRRGRRRDLEPAQPRALVSHVHRRRRRADAARREGRATAARRAAGHRLGERREDSLAERRPAAAARQGRQAADLAPDAAPRRAPRHHLPVVLGPLADRGAPRPACARCASGCETVPRTDPAKGTLRFYADAARYLVDPVPYAVAKYRSADYAATRARNCCRPAASMRSSATSCRRW